MKDVGIWMLAKENCQKVHIPYLTYEHFIDCCYSNSYYEYCKQVACSCSIRATVCCCRYWFFVLFLLLLLLLLPLVPSNFFPDGIFDFCNTHREGEIFA